MIEQGSECQRAPSRVFLMTRKDSNASHSVIKGKIPICVSDAKVLMDSGCYLFIVYTDVRSNTGHTPIYLYFISLTSSRMTSVLLASSIFR